MIKIAQNESDMELDVVNFIYQLVEASRRSGCNSLRSVGIVNGGTQHEDEPGVHTKK